MEEEVIKQIPSDKEITLDTIKHGKQLFINWNCKEANNYTIQGAFYENKFTTKVEQKEENFAFCKTFLVIIVIFVAAIILFIVIYKIVKKRKQQKLPSLGIDSIPAVQLQSDSNASKSNIDASYDVKQEG